MFWPTVFCDRQLLSSLGILTPSKNRGGGTFTLSNDEMYSQEIQGSFMLLLGVNPGLSQ
jgi:hypothetical protein